MPIPYNQNVPLANQQKNASQPIMLSNFQAINELIPVDHVGFNVANFGFHNKVTLVLQTSTPSFGTKTGFWSQLNSTTGLADTFVAQILASGNKIGSLTSSILSTVAAPLANSAGWAFMPNGILLKWGNALANGQATINFPVAANIPVFTTCITVVVWVAQGSIGVDVNQAIRLVGVNPANFLVYGSSRTAVGAAAVDFGYLAIGY